MTREQIEAEVQAAFPIKSRVRLSAKAKIFAIAKHHDRVGDVLGYALGGYAIDGFESMSCLRVHWDGNSDKSIHVAHYTRYEIAPPPEPSSGS